MSAARKQHAIRHPRQRRSRIKRIARRVERVSRVVLVWMLLVSALYGAGYALLHGGVFTVQQVVVRGDFTHLSESTVLEMAAIQTGHDLYDVVLNDVRARVEKNPWVNTVAVRRKLPHSIWVFVTEREPVAMLNLQGLYLIDTHGEIFKARDSQDPADLPIVSGVTDVVVNQQGVGFSAQVEELLAVHQMYEAHPISEQLGCSEVTRDQFGRISLITEQPVMRVRVGAQATWEQWDRLQAVVSSIEETKTLPRSIDLYIERKAVARYDAAHST